MKLSQRILFPTLAAFIVAIAGLFVYSYLTNQATNRERERIDDTQLEAAFNAKVESQGNLALGLAFEAANNPSIQDAFARRDRQALTELTLQSYQILNQQFDLPQYQYHIPPAISFLRLHDLGRFGDDLSTFRQTVVQANETKLPVMGLEVGRGGLGLRGVVPVFYQDQPIGSVEFGSNVDDTFLNALKAEYGHDWRILLTRQSLELATLQDFTNFEPGPTLDLFLLAATNSSLPYAGSDYYDNLIKGNKTSVSIRTTDNKNYRIYGFPLVDFSGKTVGTVEVFTDLGPALAQQTSRILFGVIAVIMAMVIGTLVLFLTTRRVLSPLSDLTRSALSISNGNLSQNIKIVNEDDEIGQLGTAFNQMTQQLRSVIGNLEQNVMERTQDLDRRRRELETASRIAREITSEQHMDQLLTNAANLIRDEFGFYHAGIFLVDDRREYAVLRAATGDAGRQLLALNHRLKIGEVGIVGFVTQTGRPRVALNVGADVTHFRNPLLPETRSEMALPLTYGGEIIGALDVQSKQESAFDDNDVKIMQTVADQLAIAINNARLAERTRENLRELGLLYQRQVRNAWKQVSQEKPSEFEYDGLNVSPVRQDLPADQVKQLSEGKTIILRGEKGSTLLVPLALQGQLIGTVGIEKDDPTYEWNRDELSIAENAATQASLALENARLLEETQRLAAKERTIGEISARIGGLVDIEKILQTTVQELSQTLPDAEVAIQFQGKDQE